MNFMSDKLFLIDSNVLVYAYDKSDEKKHERARKLLLSCWEGSIVYAISTQNLEEFFYIVTRKIAQPLSVQQAHQVIADIVSFSHWRVLSYNERTLLKATQLNGKFWDALIASTMLENEIFNIYTEDTSDFKCFMHINAINPFA